MKHLKTRKNNDGPSAETIELIGRVRRGELKDLDGMGEAELSQLEGQLTKALDEVAESISDGGFANLRAFRLSASSSDAERAVIELLEARTPVVRKINSIHADVDRERAKQRHEWSTVIAFGNECQRMSDVLSGGLPTDLIHKAPAPSMSASEIASKSYDELDSALDSSEFNKNRARDELQRIDASLKGIEALLESDGLKRAVDMLEARRDQLSATIVARNDDIEAVSAEIARRDAERRERERAQADLPGIVEQLKKRIADLESRGA